MELTTIPDGGVTSAKGFMAGGIASGYHSDSDRMDLALVESREPCCVAGVFTQSEFAAAPVQLDRTNLGSLGASVAKAVVINSGCANAATGPKGLENAKEERHIAADAIQCTDDDVLIASTGQIGQQLNLDQFRNSLPQLHKKITSDTKGGHEAALAIMTTDRHPKEYAVKYFDEDINTEITVGGMVKGAGMIMPNMATMIAVITTDLSLAQTAAHQALVDAVNQSFNKVSVDSDTSTNDTCILMASGEACEDYSYPIALNSPSYKRFCEALNKVTQELAKDIAGDGEGSTRMITVNVSGAETEEDADKAARAVANSPLVQTAVAGKDDNWGVIVAALGKSQAKFSQENVDLSLLGIPMLVGGMPVDYGKADVTKAYENFEVPIDINLHEGNAKTTIWSCDLTCDYVHLNGAYQA